MPKTLTVVQPPVSLSCRAAVAANGSLGSSMTTATFASGEAAKVALGEPEFREVAEIRAAHCYSLQVLYQKEHTG